MAKPKMYVWQAQVGERKKMEGNCIYLSGVGNKQLTTMTTFSAAASKCSECDVIAGLGEFGHLLRRTSWGSSRVYLQLITLLVYSLLITTAALDENITS